MLTVKALISCSLALTTLAITKHSGKEYIINFDSDVYICPDEESHGFIETSRLKAVRHNVTTAILTGPFQLKQDVNSQLVIELSISKEYHGRYEVIATEKINDLCEELSSEQENIYTTFLKYANLPDNCPIPAGEYMISDMTVDTKDLSISAVSVGRYQCVARFYACAEPCNTKKYLGCAMTDALIEPAEE